MAKNEVECQDCGNTLFDNSNEIKLCICYGEHRGEKIKVKLEKNNISLDIPKNIDLENIKMLLDSFKNRLK